MWVVFLLLILLIGALLASVEISLNEIDIKEKEYNYRIIINFKLFGLLKILTFTLDRFGLKLFGKKLKVNFRQIRKLDKASLDLLKDLNINLKKVDFNLKIGIIDIGLTNIAIVLISTIFPIFIRNKIKRRKLKFSILPEYNKFYIKYKGEIVVSIKLLTLIKFYFKNIKRETTHNKDKIMV